MPIGQLDPKFKAMLCAQKATMDDVTYPVYVSTKYDGIRCIHNGDTLTSRELIDTPNKRLNDFAKTFWSALQMLDCELIVGPANAKNVCAASGSVWSSHDKDTKDFRLYVFDIVDYPQQAFVTRQERLQQIFKGLSRDDYSHLEYRLMDHLVLVEQHLIHDRQALEAFYVQQIEDGYEGVVTAKGDMPYKFGRSTIKEAGRLKLKPRETSEALILGMYEAEHNANAAGTDNYGRVKRSTAKEGKVAKGTCGGFVVQDVNTGVTFNLGGGKFFTDKSRKHAWENFEAEYRGRVITYSFCPIGVKDKPRQPQAEQLRPTGV